MISQVTSLLSLWKIELWSQKPRIFFFFYTNALFCLNIHAKLLWIVLSRNITALYLQYKKESQARGDTCSIHFKANFVNNMGKWRWKMKPNPPTVTLIVSDISLCHIVVCYCMWAVVLPDLCVNIILYALLYEQYH